METSDNNPATQPSEVSDNGVKDSSKEKTFTEEQVNKLIAKRVNEVNESNARRSKDAINEAIAEYERKQKLTEDERLNEERKARDAELAEKERNITMRENRADAIEALAAKGIDTKLADFVVDLDKDKQELKIKQLEKTFNEAVTKSVEAKLAGKTPTDFGDGSKQKDKGKTLTSAGYTSHGGAVAF